MKYMFAIVWALCLALDPTVTLTVTGVALYFHDQEMKKREK